MSDDKKTENTNETPVQKDSEKNAPKKGGRFSGAGRRKRRRPTLSAADLERIQNEDLQETVDAVEKEREEAETQESSDVAPPLDKEALVKEYTDKYAQYEQLAKTIAEHKTTLSAQQVEYKTITANTAHAKQVLEVKFAQEKIDQVQAFLAELKDVQDALGTIIQDIEALTSDQDNEGLASFVQGLQIIGSSLTSVFNEFTGKQVSPVQPPEHSAPQTYTADVIAQIDITDETTAQDVQNAIALMTSKTQQAEKTNQEIVSQMKELATATENAQSNAEKDIERTQRNLEKNAPYAIEKVAKASLEIADNLERAVQTLEQQKEALGDTFNAIAEKVLKGEQEIQDAFNKFGVRKVDTAIGKKPNLEYDNVIAAMPAPANVTAEKGDIIAIDRIGYTLNDERVIRESTVITAAG